MTDMTNIRLYNLIVNVINYGTPEYNFFDPILQKISESTRTEQIPLLLDFPNRVKEFLDNHKPTSSQYNAIKNAYETYQLYEKRLSYSKNIEKAPVDNHDGYSTKSEYKVLPTQWTRFKEHIFEEEAFIVEIDDDAGGPFIVIKQLNDHIEYGKITFNDDEINDLKTMLDQAVNTIKLMDNIN